MVASQLPQGKIQFLDANGDPLENGTVTFYVPSSTTPKTTWQDAGKSIMNTNPVVLNARGEALIYGRGAYRMILKDALGNTIYDVNTYAPISSALATAQGDLLYADSNLEWQVLAPGSDGAVLTSGGAGADPYWGGTSGIDWINVKDYGATGDGTTDDTAAIQAAIAVAIDQNRVIYFPKGTYIITQIVWNPPGYARMPNWIGDGPTVSVLKRKTGSAFDSMVILGSSASTFFLLCSITGIGFDGRDKATTNKAVEAFNWIRSSMQDCKFINAVEGFYSNGGIDVEVVNCIADSNTRGIKFETFASMAGNSYPNLIKIQNCGIYTNSGWGIWFDSGRFCTVENNDIEGNGTVADGNSGGVRMGALIGAEGGTLPTIGGIIENNWFEANAGGASVVCLAGRNAMSNNLYIANPDASYDIYLDTCAYVISNETFNSAKTYNIFENANTLTGNAINNCSSGFTYTLAQALSAKIDYKPIVARFDYVSTSALPTSNTLLVWTVSNDPYGVYSAGTITVPAGATYMTITANQPVTLANGDFANMILMQGATAIGTNVVVRPTEYVGSGNDQITLSYSNLPVAAGNTFTITIRAGTSSSTFGNTAGVVNVDKGRMTVTFF
jgi:hypothetical protein